MQRVIPLHGMGGEQGGDGMGAMHLALREVAADAGDSFLLVKRAGFGLAGVDIQRGMAL